MEEASDFLVVPVVSSYPVSSYHLPHYSRFTSVSCRFPSFTYRNEK